MKKEQSPTLYRGNVCKPMLEDYVKFESRLYILKQINKKDGTLLLKENHSEKEIFVETFKCDFFRRKSLKDQISIYKRYHKFVRIKQEDYPESEWIELGLRGSESGHPCCRRAIVFEELLKNN